MIFVVKSTNNELRVEIAGLGYAGSCRVESAIEVEY